MAVYSWSGYNEKGKDARGMVDASSPREAKLKLRSQGIFVKDISEETPEALTTGRDLSLNHLFSRVKTEDLTVMTRQLATLVGAAIPLVDALNALYEQTEHPLLKTTMAQVRDAVNEGSSFADALDQHKRIFPELYINMVRSGEASGALDVVLIRLAEFLENQHRLKSKVGTALIYPVVLLVVCLVVLFYLLTSIVPKVVSMFENMNQVLPLPTRILISVSDFFAVAWWAVLLVLAFSIFLLVRWKRTDKGAFKFDRFKMRAPLYGPIYRKVTVARFSRTLGTLLSSGVPIIEALRIVQSVVLNKVVEAAIDDAVNEVMDGSSIAGTLKKSGVFPPLILHMIGVGEKSGTLEEMLIKAADAYEEEVETAVAGLTAVLEPAMILVMAVLVGFVVMAILFPMLEMSTIVR